MAEATDVSEALLPHNFCTVVETGSVHLASSAARLTARSAYRLRTRSPAFARAWDTALQLSVGRLAAIVFDGRLDNRDELLDNADIAAGDRAAVGDAAIVLRTYAARGADCVDCLRVDFAFEALA